MGLEARCRCSVAGSGQMVSALLESKELILKGESRRCILIESISRPRVEAGQLVFVTGPDTIRLELGELNAQKWLKKITTPPPSLAAKLGVKDNTKVYLINGQRSAEVNTAVAGHVTKEMGQADLLCAVVVNLEQLDDVLARAAGFKRLPIWTIYPKGKTSTLPDTLIRHAMRTAGYIDTKVSAVSDQLSATRYLRQKA